MKLTIRNIVRIITLAPLTIYLLYCVCFFIVYPLHPKYNDCGKIISKSNDEVAIKHGSRTELYLNIQFNKTGFKSIEVSPTTYFKHSIGATICFDLDKETSRWYTTSIFVGGLTSFMIIVVLILYLIFYLTGNEEELSIK